MHLTEMILDVCSKVIVDFGYVGIFVLMFFESMYVPVPSEAVMPFVGIVAYEVSVNERPSGPEFWLACVVAALGGLAGSLTTYYFGKWAGPVGVRKWGKYGGLVEDDLDKTQKFFDRWGAVTVFLFRFVPVVRHFISTVAGIAKMRLAPFVVMTTTGAFLWGLFLAWLGWHFAKQNIRGEIHKYNQIADVVVVVLGVVAFFVVLRHLRGRKPVAPSTGAPPAAVVDGPPVPPGS